MNCPNCQLPLQASQPDAKEPISICQQCWGIWVDGDQLSHTGWRDGLPSARREETSFKSCPKCNGSMQLLTYQVEHEPLGVDQCTSCHGVWFDDKKELLKMRRLYDIRQVRKKKVSAPQLVINETNGPVDWLLKRMFQEEPGEHIALIIGRAVLFLLLLIMTWKFLKNPMESNYVGQHFLHGVNLIFHEAGHVVFRPFGRFMMVLGGSLMQLLMPFLCVAAFLKYRNPFAASVGLWWVAENFLDIAPYINDARARKLQLLGGKTGMQVFDAHDWTYLLMELDWMPYDRTIATFTYNFGLVLMMSALVWGGYILYKQFANR